MGREDQADRSIIGRSVDDTYFFFSQHLQVQWHLAGFPSHLQEQPSGPHSQFLQHWHLHWYLVAMMVSPHSLKCLVTHISILTSSYKPLDVHRHLCLCRFERDKDALEGHTLWVRDKISHFSSRSTVL